MFFLIPLFTGIIYSNALYVPFIFDDYDNIVNNPYIKVTEFSFQQLYESAFRGIHSARPLAKLTFALNYYFSGEDVFWYHIINLIVHSANGILVFFISYNLLRAIINTEYKNSPEVENTSIILMSLMTAEIFLAHPIQVQSVSYIVQRMNILCVFFCFLSMQLFLLGRFTKDFLSRNVLYFFSIIAWTLALSSKQIAAILPALILLIEWLINPDLISRLKKRSILVFIVVFILITVVSVIYLGANPVDRILADYEIRDFSLIERLLTESRVIFFYLGLVFLPLPDRLNLLHQFTISTSLIDPATTVLSITGIILLVCISFWFRKISRLFSFAILWFLLCLIIESSIIGLEIVFEHRLYMPLFGIALVFSWMVYKLFRERNFYFSIFATFIVISLGSGTYLRNLAWSSETSIWMDVVSKHPGSLTGNYNLAKAFQNSGSYKSAVDYYQKVIELNVNYFPAYNNLGIIYVENREYQEALEYFSATIELDKNNPDAYVNIAATLKEIGNVEEALKYIDVALGINNTHPKALYLLASIQQEQGNNIESEANYLKSIEINRNQPMALNNLAVLLMQKGNIDTAIELLSEAILLNPGLSLAHFNLGYANLYIGNTEDACRSFQTGLLFASDELPIQLQIEQNCQ